MNSELIKRILSSVCLIPLVLFFIIKGGFFFNFFILICLLISIIEWNTMTKNKKYKIPGIIFLIFSFYSAYYMRNEMYDDYLYFILILFICIFTDIGGYVFGKIFKGPKLTKISPNKTYSGVLGSFVFSIIFGSLYIFYLKISLNFEINYFIVIIVVSLTSQIGDLIISLFKRKAKIKDTGSILPGHGGILDRIDGILLALPIGLLLISI